MAVDRPRRCSRPVARPDSTWRHRGPPPPAPSYTEGFSSETIGGQPTTFAPLVRLLVDRADGDNRVLLEDGGRWT